MYRHILVILFLMVLAPTASAKEQQRTTDGTGAIGKKIVDSAVSILAELNKHTPESSRIVQFFSGVSKWLSDQTKPSKSFLDYKDVERVRVDIEKLDKLSPAQLEPLMSRPSLRRFATAGETTVISGSAELRKMQQAVDVRRNEIHALERQRDDLTRTREAYATTEATAREVADRIGRELGNVPLNIVVLFEGHSLPMSWYDLSQELQPALWDRVRAADAALKRYDAEIASAERDLKTFTEAREALDRIWNVPVAASSPSAIGDLQVKMKNDIQATVTSANEMRKEAAAIRDHNARIAAIQKLMSIGKNLGDLYQAGKALSKKSADDSGPNNTLIWIGTEPEQPPNTSAPDQRNTPHPGALRL
ncbi:hypothetical protein [Bradyrhizobium sp. DOA9]|uniref:hypothetical protein n=1 Tax=Bradyrhizobium sp. DOA9 TaxID=1126627 RepID=UPI0004689161|nr:hypothetical protein [Bradyrhizobium sp. DOA9]GAJ31426.1 hypothetical protein BDOA9_0106050 [Bradyrhizobium sp. DOA9]